MQALNIAAAGMFAAADRLSASAQRTAAWGVEQTQAVDKASADKAAPNGTSTVKGGDDTDLTKEAVEQISAKTDFAANAAVAKTADQMMGALLDIKA